LHDLVHVVIAVIHEGLNKVRQRRAYVAEMNLPDFLRAEVANHLFGVFAGKLAAALKPRAATQADAHVGAVRDLHGAAVAVEVGENAARHSGQNWHWRIVGMDSDTHSRLLRNRRHLPDEIRVVRPDLFPGEFAAVGERLLENRAVPDALFIRTRHVELAALGAANRRPSAAPDSIAHMSIRGIVDSGLAQVAEILFVLFDLPGAAGKI